MPDAQQTQHLELLAPALAGGGGAVIGAVFGPAKTPFQHVLEVTCVTMGVVIFGPVVCQWAGVEAAGSPVAGGVYGGLGLVGAIAFRCFFAVAEAVADQVEAGKSETAKWLVGLVWNRFRRPEK